MGLVEFYVIIDLYLRLAAWLRAEVRRQNRTELRPKIQTDKFNILLESLQKRGISHTFREMVVDINNKQK